LDDVASNIVESNIQHVARPYRELGGELGGGVVQDGLLQRHQHHVYAGR